MSQLVLKKYLNVHTKDQLVKIILDMYSGNEFVKRYREHLMRPVYVDNDLHDTFKPRCNSCVSSASNLGYGYGDDMWDIYYEYYRDSDIQ
jgi:hypothetical protein